MRRPLLALVLLASCGHTEALHCAAVVTGTGAPADGTYECTQPAQAVYTPSTGTGQLTGFAFAPNGMQVTFNISIPGRPAVGTYTESSGAVSILSQGGSNPLWEPGSFILTVRALNTKNIYPYTLAEVWPEIRGTLTATLIPAAGNPATKNATVSMDF